MPLTPQEIEKARQTVIDKLNQLVQEKQRLEQDIREIDAQIKRLPPDNPQLDDLHERRCNKSYEIRKKKETIDWLIG